MSEIPVIPPVLQDCDRETSLSEYAAWFAIMICAALLANIFHPVIAGLDQPEHKFMFEKIAGHVAEDYEYEIDIFDCSEFSEELYRRLDNTGYDDVRIDVGCMADAGNTSIADFDSCHAWVVLTLGNEEIYIESTTGEIKSGAYYRDRFPFFRYSTRGDLPLK